MNKLNQLIGEVVEARERFIASVSSLSSEQANFKPSSEVWSVTENTEHIVRAEEGGVSGMWGAFEELRQNKSAFRIPHTNAGLSIEEVVEKTWQPKEKVPEVAAPKWGGAIGYWITTLRSKQSVLEALGNELGETDLESVVYSHPISGPLDVRQRLEFLRFHLDRHRKQVEALKQHPQFPKNEDA